MSIAIGKRAQKDPNGYYASEFFPTPEWATWGLLENEKFYGSIWECACGDGAMAAVLRQAGYAGVIASDLHDRGGLADGCRSGVDFLSTHKIVRNIITNPPFSLAQKFAERAIHTAHAKAALLLPLAFLEGAARGRDFFCQNTAHADLGVQREAEFLSARRRSARQWRARLRLVCVGQNRSALSAWRTPRTGLDRAGNAR